MIYGFAWSKIDPCSDLGGHGFDSLSDFDAASSLVGFDPGSMSKRAEVKAGLATAANPFVTAAKPLQVADGRAVKARCY